MMRTVIAVIIFAAAHVAAHAQTPESNVSCVERLTIPEYPALAKQAQIQGTITATFTVPSLGSSPKVKTEYSGPLDGKKVVAMLQVTVEKAIHGATFRQGCAGKQVRLIFHFELIDDPRTRPTQSVSFGSGNEFWISVVPPSWQP